VAAFRIVTTAWGDPVPLDRERAKMLRGKAEAQYNETRKKGSKINSPAMDMLDQFARDYDGGLIGPRDLTHEYLAGPNHHVRSERSALSQRP